MNSVARQTVAGYFLCLIAYHLFRAIIIMMGLLFEELGILGNLWNGAFGNALFAGFLPAFLSFSAVEYKLKKANIKIVAYSFAVTVAIFYVALPIFLFFTWNSGMSFTAEELLYFFMIGVLTTAISVYWGRNKLNL